MQIESCGHPTVVSHAGAQGLFQVMPFHFSATEVMLDPDTNAQRSANFINECMTYANGDIGLVLGCYNGGPSVTRRPFNTWAHETQRYYVWGLSIYYDAVDFESESRTLTDWLNAGGGSL
jgi:soluble lytic murein transglycosylase-like protein